MLGEVLQQGGRDSPFRRLLSGFRNFVHIVAVGKEGRRGGWTFEGAFLRIDMDPLVGSSGVIAWDHEV